jgi:DNA-binding transcriptional LysR family regulator
VAQVQSIRHQRSGAPTMSMPFFVPVPEVRMYWHARHDDEPPHRWLRDQIQEAVDALGFREATIGIAP